MSQLRWMRKTVTYFFLAIYSLGTVFPFFWMISSSFKSRGAIMEIPPKWIPDLLFKPGMWDNYISVLFEHHFFLYLWNSTFISVVASVGQIITCSMAGFAFARMFFRGRDFIFAILVATLMIPVEVTIIPEFLIFTKIHWIDTFLPLIIPSLLVGAFGTFLLKEHFLGMPQSLEDAAIIDGCKSFQVYWYVFMPSAMPQLATLFIIAFMNNWNDLLRPVLYIQSEALRTVSIGLTQFQSDYATDWNLLIAASVVTILPLIIVYMFNQKYIIEGMVTSGVKG